MADITTALYGKVITAIVKNHDTQDGDIIIFVLDNGEQYKMWHRQDCCESCTIESIDGDLQDIIGDPVLIAEERTQDGVKEDLQLDSSTWTFYTIRTVKASVTIRWYGYSNGYYSESVNFEKINS